MIELKNKGMKFSRKWRTTFTPIPLTVWNEVPGFGSGRNVRRILIFPGIYRRRYSGEFGRFIWSPIKTWAPINWLISLAATAMTCYVIYLAMLLFVRFSEMK